jgi:hypothetical protein
MTSSNLMDLQEESYTRHEDTATRWRESTIITAESLIEYQGLVKRLFGGHMCGHGVG